MVPGLAFDRLAKIAKEKPMTDDEIREEVAQLLTSKVGRQEFAAHMKLVRDALGHLAEGFEVMATQVLATREALAGLELMYCRECGAIIPRGKCRPSASEGGLTIYCPKCKVGVVVPLVNVDLTKLKSKPGEENESKES